MNRKISPVLRIVAAIALGALAVPSMTSDAAANGYHGHGHGKHGRGHDRHWRGHGYAHGKWDRGYRAWYRAPVYRAPVYYVRQARPPRHSINIFIGSFFGTAFDGADRYNVQYALETVPTGNAVVWSNPSSGYRYSVTPVRTWQAPDATYCREFTTVGTIGGQQQQMYGTACRQPDGSWETQ